MTAYGDKRTEIPWLSWWQTTFNDPIAKVQEEWLASLECGDPIATGVDSWAIPVDIELECTIDDEGQALVDPPETPDPFYQLPARY